MVIGVAAVVGTVYTPSYVVEVDGVALGTVTSPSVFEDVVDRVESRATDILGYDYTMDGAVTTPLPDGAGVHHPPWRTLRPTSLTRLAR